MKRIKRNIVIIMLLLFMFPNVSVFAQQDLLLTQQWFSRINRNPASTGNTDFLDIFYLTRTQWTGIGNEGPRTNLINVHSYFDRIRSGLGLTFSHDALGLSYSTVDVMLTYAFHVNLTEELLLSLGVSGGILNRSWDPNRHRLRDFEEWGMPTFPNEVIDELSPNFNFGFELSMPRLLIGASITNLGRFRGNDNFTTLTTVQQHYVYARGNFELNESFRLAPSFVYLNTGRVNMLSIGAMLFYNNMFWFGLDYRPPAPTDFRRFNYSTLTAMLGVEWSFFRLGYSYDISLGRLHKLSASTHELMLSFMIPTVGRNRTPLGVIRQ